MNAHTLAARAALRHAGSYTRRLPTPRLFAATYHSYSLPTSTRPANRDDIPETPIVSPEPLPKVHETRPPPQPQQSTQPEAATQKKPAARPRPKLRARKAAMKLSPAAVEQLRAMLDQPDPKLIKVGVRNRGCSGLAYHLEYVDKAGAFDEMVEQDGVKVLIDSKALFSIIGSEMDWAEDKLNQRFVFKNPNISEWFSVLQCFRRRG